MDQEESGGIIMRKTVKRLYHATPGHNLAGIMAKGEIEPSWDGYVHLTTSKADALRYAARYGNGAAVFVVTLDKLDPTKIKQYSGGVSENDECYGHLGPLAMKLAFKTSRIIENPILAALNENARNHPGLAESAARYQAEGIISK